ncbi:MAG: type II toxin-antitoxin system VapC family toxin [Methylophilaceae bacterium]
MVAFVVDNSVAIAWAYPKQATEYTERLLDIGSHGLLHTAFIWPAEFANATFTLVNRGLLGVDTAPEVLAMANDFGLIVDKPQSPESLYSVAREFGLSAYDAAYLELAIRLNMPLATRDKDLKLAAEKLNLYFA